MFISLIVSAGLLVGTSMAWLAMNKNVSSNGMEMQIEVTPNLVISDTLDGGGLIQVNNEHPYSVEYTTSDTHYSPATHDLTKSAGVLIHSSGLKYVDNIGAISLTTGLESSGAVFRYNTAINGSSVYYVDKVVYIAAVSGSMDDATLKCTIASATKIVGSSANEISSGSLMATSIDIYSGTEVSTENYKGTINVAKSAGCDEVTVFVGDIPQDTEGKLTFTLRFYFDGALTSAPGQAYIYSSELDTSKVTINVMFYVDED